MTETIMKILPSLESKIIAKAWNWPKSSFKFSWSELTTYFLQRIIFIFLCLEWKTEE